MHFKVVNNMQDSGVRVSLTVNYSVLITVVPKNDIRGTQRPFQIYSYDTPVCIFVFCGLAKRV